MAALSDWNRIQQAPEYWNYDPQQRATIKANWFKRNIAGTPEFRSYSEDQQVSILNKFAQQGDDVSPERTFWGTLGDLGLSVTKGLVGTGQAVVGLANLASGGHAGKALEESGVDLKGAQDYLSSGFSPAQKAANERVQKAEGFLGTAAEMIKNPSTIAMAGAESLPSMVGGGLLARGGLAVGAKLIPKVAKSLQAGSKTLPMAAGASGEGVVSMGQSAEDIRQQSPGGLLSPDQMVKAAGSGIGTAIFGAVGGRLAQRFGFADPDTMLATIGKKVGREVPNGMGVAARIAGGGISEGLFEELPQSVQETIWQNAALGKPLMEGVPESAATGFLVGGAMGAGANLISRKEAESNIGKAENVDQAIDAFNEATKPELTSPDITTGPKLDDALLNDPIHRARVENQANMDRIMRGAGDIVQPTEPVQFPGQTAEEQQQAQADILRQRQQAAIQRAHEAVRKAGLVKTGEIPGQTVDPTQQAREVSRLETSRLTPPTITTGRGPTAFADELQQARARAQQAAQVDQQRKQKESQRGSYTQSVQERAVEAQRRLKEAERTGVEIDPSERRRLNFIIEAAKQAPREPVDYSQMRETGRWTEPARQDQVPAETMELDTPETPPAALPPGQGGESLEAPESGGTSVDAKANEAATSPENDLPEPTDAQKEAGNYKKGHARISGLDISIENPDGSTRSGVSPDGKKWESKMRGHYGYFRRTEGKDGDQIDVFIAPGSQDTGRAFVVDQVDPKTGKFDEHKTILGANSIEEARELYLSNYEKGWKGLGAITEMDMPAFKGWLAQGKQTHPVGNVAGVAKDEAKSEWIEGHLQTTDRNDRWWTHLIRARYAAKDIGLTDKQVDWNDLDSLVAAIDAHDKSATKLFDQTKAEPPEDIGPIGKFNIPALARMFSGSIRSGQIPKNKIDVQSAVAKALGVKRADMLNHPDWSHKPVEEAFEYAVVTRAREIVRQSTNDEETFQALKDLYESMPNLATRTSTSVTNQAYSTPVHLAFLMQRYAGIDSKASVYEPTAGTGMLVTTADPENVWANEIDPTRFSILKDQNFLLSRIDGQEAVGHREPITKPYNKGPQPKAFDAVMANPPFGSIQSRDINGWKISKLEHAIIADALKAMKDNGKAALIIGGEHVNENGQANINQQVFLNYLHHHFNVEAIVEIPGEQYAKQGAKFPVRLILINGRKKTPSGTAPAPEGDDIGAYVKGKSLPYYSRVINIGQVADLIKEVGNAAKTLDTRRTEEVPESEEGSRRPGFKGTQRPSIQRPASGKGGGADQESQEPGTDSDLPESTSERPEQPQRPGSRLPGYGRPGTGLAPAGPRDDNVPEDQEESRPSGDIQDAGPGQRPGADSEGVSKGTVRTDAGGISRTGDIDQTINDLLNLSSQEAESAKQREAKETIKSGAEKVAAGIKKFNDILGKTGQIGLDIDPGSDSRWPQMHEALKEIWAGLKEIHKGIRQAAEAFIKDVYKQLSSAGKPFIDKFIKEDIRADLESEAKADQKSSTPKATAQDEETEYQTVYSPKSKGPIIDTTLMPRRMKEAVDGALTRLEDRVGDIDSFVADKLRYKSTQALYKAMSADQIDAVALAIDNIENGAGMVIGDQTGVGKGRIAAAIWKYARLNQNKPVFFTAKPQLFTDFYRDITDIGYSFNPLLMASKMQEGTIVDKNGDPVHKVLPPGPRNAAYRDMRDDGQNGLGQFDGVLATYSQINQARLQQEALRPMFDGNIIVLDEAHKAAGPDSETGNFIRGAMENSRGVVYLSATFAKRPDTMPLYYKTDMSRANLSIEELIAAVQAGDTPLQEILSSDLAKVGQYVRREKSFKGIGVHTITDTKNRTRDESRSDAMTSIMRDVLHLDTKIAEEFSKAVKRAKKQGAQYVWGVPIPGAIKVEGNTLAATVSRSNFAATVHNAVRQLLFAMKVDTVVDQAVEALSERSAIEHQSNGKYRVVDSKGNVIAKDLDKEIADMTVAKDGRKVFIALDNTMGSFVEHMLEDGDLGVGAKFEVTFGSILKRSLDRALRVKVTDPHGREQSYNIDPDQMPDDLRGRYMDALDKIENDVSEIPGSPIDAIAAKLIRKGYRVGEITGRDYVADFTDINRITLRKRTAQEKAAKKEILKNFNDGKLDVIIVNRSAAEGVSAHASTATGKDLRPRIFIGAQSQLNVDDEVQLMGRINRKGQVMLPMYKQVFLDIPAELRPAAVLMRKMKSLSATTSANSDSPLSQKTLPDMDNKYGNQVVAQWLAENALVRDALGLDAASGFMAVSGKIAMMPVEVQRSFFEDVELEYNLLVQDMKEQGLYDLEVQDLDYKARSVEKVVTNSGRDESNPFGASTYREKLSVKSPTKPFKGERIRRMVDERLDGKDPEDIKRSFLKDLDKESEAYIADRRRAAEAEGQSFSDANILGAQDFIRRAIERTNIGDTYRLQVEGLPTMTGVLLGYKRAKGRGNPAAGSRTRLEFAVNNSLRKVSITISKLEKGEASFGHVTRGIIGNWDEITGTDMRQEIYMITGNLLQGFANVPPGSRIVRFTMEDGTLREGIQLPLNYNPAEQGDTVQVTPEEAYDILMSGTPLKGTSVTITTGHDILVPQSRLSGGRYFLDDTLRGYVERGEFETRGEHMRAHIIAGREREAIARVYELGDSFSVPRSAFQEGNSEQPLYARRAPQVETEAFKRWFGKSVVTVDGKPGSEPLVVYHGTDSDFTVFDTKKGFKTEEMHASAALGSFFTNDPEIAGVYTGRANKSGGDGGNVMPVFLSIQNPYYMEAKEMMGLNTFPAARKKIKELKRKGYDGIIQKGVEGLPDTEMRQIVAFEPTQIKSAIGNSGAFSPTNPSILYSMRPPGGKGTQTAPTLQKTISTITAQWSSAPKVQVVQSQSELPGDILDHLKAIGAENDIVDGTFYQGTVYLVADNLASEKAAVNTMLHESFGHYGLRELLGERFKMMLMQVYASHKAEIQPIADEYGFDITKLRDRILAADEWLSRHVSENEQSSWIDKIISAIRSFVRRIAPDLKFSDAEIRNLLDAARSRVVGTSPTLAGAGSGASILDPAYAKAYHGTPHIWPPEKGFPHGRPRLDKIGTGEGAASYGWGFYTAENDQVGKSYKDSLAVTSKARAQVMEDGRNDYSVWALKPGDEQISMIGEHLLYGKAHQLKDKWDAENSGALYNLDIPDDVIPKLLDWDAPLDDQPKKFIELVEKHLNGVRMSGAYFRDNFETGGKAYKTLALKLGGDKKLSEQLSSMGIPGNKYLDGMSRNKGKGSYNYVIWDQKVLDRIALLERNGEKLEAMRDAESEPAFKRTAASPPAPAKAGPSYADTLGPTTEKDFAEHRNLKRNLKLSAEASVSRVTSEITEGLDKYLGAISTRLGNISPKLRDALRSMDFRIGTQHTKDVQSVQPLLRKVKKSMTREDYADWSYARLNSVTWKLDELKKKYDIQEEYSATRRVLDRIWDEAHDVGLVMGKIEEYWPRVLKDARGFLKAIQKGKDGKGNPDWPVITRRLKEKAKELGISIEQMNPDQRAQIISQMVLSGQYGLGGPPATKQRKLEKIPAYLAPYYMDPDSALMAHIYGMRKAIEGRKFFGRIPQDVAEVRKRLFTVQTNMRKLQQQMNGLPQDDEQRIKLKKRWNKLFGLEKEYQAYIETYALNRDFRDNIGAYVDELVINKEIQPHQEKTVIDILNARFHERGTYGIVQTYKNFSYLDTMGSVTSALTQIGDLSWTAYEVGLIKALKYAYKAARKSSRITKEDVGIERVAQEFEDATTLGKAVSKVFKLVGLEKMDSIGKESLLNAAYDKYRERARKEPGKLRAQIEPMFGAETDSVIQDLLDDQITENVKLLVYARLLDFQPVALSEMSEKYLNAGNGRVFYMLKTFTLKQFDVYRREVYNKLRYGDRSEKIQAIKNLTRLSMFFVLANAGADELKDWVLGRTTDFEDRAVDNMLRLFGVSKFITWQARTEGVGTAMAKQILPPFKFINAVSRDITSDKEGSETLASIPVVGKLAYWHMGAGVNKREDLWDSRLRKEKSRLNSIKERMEEADNINAFRMEYSDDLNRLGQVNSMQYKLNQYRKRISRMEKMEPTAERRALIEKLKERRIALIKQFLKEK